MSVVRRGSVVAVVAGLVLLGGPAWAQEDPCAPGPDGSVPEMCQSGAPVSDTGTVGMEPEQPCPEQPVEPGDGVVTDGGDPGTSEPGTEPEPVPEGEPKPEPAPEDGPTLAGPPPGAINDDGLICAFSAPVADGAPELAAGGGTAAGQLPRTGPYDRLLALTALGSGLVVVGAGAAAAGRRRRAT